MLRLTFPSKLNWGSYITHIAKSASKKIGALIHSMKFFSFEFTLYLYKCTTQLSMEKTVAMSRMVLLAATWNC